MSEKELKAINLAGLLIPEDDVGTERFLQLIIDIRGLIAEYGLSFENFVDVAKVYSETHFDLERIAKSKE